MGSKKKKNKKHDDFTLRLVFLLMNTKKTNCTHRHSWIKSFSNSSRICPFVCLLVCLSDWHSLHSIVCSPCSSFMMEPFARSLARLFARSFLRCMKINSIKAQFWSRNILFKIRTLNYFVFDDVCICWVQCPPIAYLVAQLWERF